MSFKRGIRIKLSELPDFIGSDVPEVIQEFKHELMDIVEDKALPFAKEYARRVMPSGGGSYVDSIQWVHEIPETRGRQIYKNELGILYSDHQWAKAVEKGTVGHQIPKEGELAVGGLGIKIAKREAAKKGWKIPKDFIPTKTKKELVSLGAQPTASYVLPPDERGRVDHSAWPGYMLIPGERPKQVELFDDTGKPMTWRSGEPMTRTEWVKQTKTQRQRTAAHEGTHALRHYQDPEAFSRKIRSASNQSWNQYRYSQHEVEAYEVERIASREIGRSIREKKDIGGIMVIEPKLAKRGARGEKGKIPRASRVPRGTKYGQEVGFAKRVMHPGARPFRIFENTSRFIHRNLNKWMNQALDRAGFR